MRNHSIDTLKFVCAVLIIFLHVPSWGWSYYLPITRCAVPCFFIISGYFLMGENMRQRMWKGCGKMVRIIIYSTLLFVIVNLILHHFIFSSIVPTTEKFLEFVFFNENPWGFHLWYLGAYLYVLLICIAIARYDKWRITYMFVPILLVTDLLFGKYSLLILHHEFPYIYVRNFLFVGLPYFLIGTYIRQKDIVVTNYREIVWGGVILAIFTSILEKHMLVQLGLNAERDHYISTTPLAILLFIWFLSRHQIAPTVLSKIGNRDSLWIYILHPLWITFFSIVNPHMPDVMQNVYGYIAPLLVLGCTMVMIVLLRRIKLIR